jgi:hypothetical protein
MVTIWRQISLVLLYSNEIWDGFEGFKFLRMQTAQSKFNKIKPIPYNVSKPTAYVMHQQV